MNTLQDILDLIPNSYPHHGWEGVDIPWDVDTGDYIIVTLDGPTTTVGIYLDGGWDRGDGPDMYVDFDTVANAVAYVDDITGDLWPEGTDWGAWVLQWTADHVDDDIAGVVGDGSGSIPGGAS